METVRSCFQCAFPMDTGYRTGFVCCTISQTEKSVSEFDWMSPLIYFKSATAVCVHIIQTGCGQADAHRLVALLVSYGQYVCRNSLNESTGTLNIDI